MSRSSALPTRTAGWLLVGLLVMPILALFAGVGPTDIARALSTPATTAAVAVSLRTTLLTTLFVLALGLPLAWTLSRRRPAPAALITAIELPIVLPPAVLGIALLETFGRAGILGGVWTTLGVSIPFSAGAVVLAQILVAAPLFVLTATEALRPVDEDLLLVARTLGASRASALARIALPAALPGLTSALALAWARALGEFGATLMFAGSLPGRTQTLPLAIYRALETDLAEARAVAVILVLLALVPLIGVRLLGVPRG